MHDAAFEDQTTQAKLVFRWVRGVFFESISRSHVEDQLILEIIQDDHNKACDAAEGQCISPESAILKLPGSGAYVDRLLRSEWLAASCREETVAGGRGRGIREKDRRDMRERSNKQGRRCDGPGAEI